MALQPAHADALREHGYALVPDFVTGAELDRLQAEIAGMVPSIDDVQAKPEQHGHGQIMSGFPFAGDALNDVIVRTDVLDFASGLIGSDNLAMSDALFVTKYGGTFNFDQALHQDFGNNDLAYPRRDGGFFQLTMILYLSDVTEDNGPTAVVAREHYGDEKRQFLEKQEAGHPLYAHETLATCKAGTLFLYDTLTYHRGTAIKDPRGVRHALFFQYADGANRWIGKHAYGHTGGTPNMNRFMTRATPRQRAVIGFPPVGHPYWNEDTLAGVARRYPEMDMTPYRQGCATG